MDNEENIDKSFVNLHVHTEFSLLDGACRIKGLVSRLKALKQDTVAITDHGVMYGCVDFYNECVLHGIKPIIGCEVYVAPRSRLQKENGIDLKPYHLILLCKNNDGYKNLVKIVSNAFTEGFYNKPRCDIETLQKYHEGLICLSGCLFGQISQLITNNNYEAAKACAFQYLEIFGNGNYYIEVQNHGLPVQKKLIPYLYKLSAETNIPIVATNDVHYLTKEDADVQRVLTAIATNTTIDSKNALNFSSNELYLKSGSEMASLTRLDAVLNTKIIAKQCNVTFEFGVTKLPYFKIEGCNDNASFFRKAVFSGLKLKYGEVLSDEVTNRANHELEIIIKMGYTDYYLIVADFVNFAKSKKIPVGPGRGSGVGSICAFAMGITAIDPLRFNLLFERFLNPERISMPDFDIDFCYIRRPEVIQYVTEKYGSDHVAQIVTFGTMAARGAIRDAGRAMGLPYATVDEVAKMIPFGVGQTLQHAIATEPNLRALGDNNPSIKRLIETAKSIEGMPRHPSIHAAGIVITREPVTEYVPLAKSDDDVVTQYTMGTLERLGLLKMDFLGLRYLTVIDDCCKSISPDFDIYGIDDLDPETYKSLSQGSTIGVFQFESEGMTNVLMRLLPTSLEDLTATISLYRPGPMASIGKYIENRHNRSKITYKHPLLKEILEVTYGCIVYQEQVMQICQKVAGYSYGRADLVRRAMSKKKRDVMEKERNAFIYGSESNIGAVNNGVSEQVATEIFDELSNFATYAFNKSHAAAYALLSFQTAYLRTHYYKEYMIALMTSVLDSAEKLCFYINDLKQHSVQVLPPSINSSLLSFSIENNVIRYGLLAIKNVGRGFINQILAERKNGKFKSLYDFCKRLMGSELSKRAVGALIKSGAMDCLYGNRRAMFMSYELLLDNLSSYHGRNIEGQLDMFGKEYACDESEFVMPNLPEFRHIQLLQMEKETIGIYISGHPVDRYDKYVAINGINSISAIKNGVSENVQLFEQGNTVKIIAMMISKHQHTTKNGQLMCFATFEDKFSSIECIVFPDLYMECIELLVDFQILLITGTISTKEEEEPKLLVTKLQQAQSLELPTYSTLYINMDENDIDKLATVYSILIANTGNDKVKLCSKTTRTVMDFKGINGIYVTKHLLEQLERICGKNNVIIK